MLLFLVYVVGATIFVLASGLLRNIPPDSTGKIPSGERPRGERHGWSDLGEQILGPGHLFFVRWSDANLVALFQGSIDEAPIIARRPIHPHLVEGGHSGSGCRIESIADVDQIDNFSLVDEIFGIHLVLQKGLRPNL